MSDGRPTGQPTAGETWANRLPSHPHDRLVYVAVYLICLSLGRRVGGGGVEEPKNPKAADQAVQAAEFRDPRGGGGGTENCAGPLPPLVADALMLEAAKQENQDADRL